MLFNTLGFLGYLFLFIYFLNVIYPTESARWIMPWVLKKKDGNYIFYRHVYAQQCRRGFIGIRWSTIAAGIGLHDMIECLGFSWRYYISRFLESNPSEAGYMIKFGSDGMSAEALREAESQSFVFYAYINTMPLGVTIVFTIMIAFCIMALAEAMSKVMKDPDAMEFYPDNAIDEDDDTKYDEAGQE